MKKYKRIHTDEFDVEKLFKLCREGKLYMEVDAAEVSVGTLLTKCRQEALQYVSAIDEFATAEWHPHIREVWEAIVNDEAFAPLLVMKQKHCLNRYYVTCLVFNLQTMSVYRPVEEVSMLALHLRMENISKKNSIFKNWGNYPFTTSQRKCLRILVEKIHRV